jgi:hypothetical protein
MTKRTITVSKMLARFVVAKIPTHAMIYFVPFLVHNGPSSKLLIEKLKKHGAASKRRNILAVDVDCAGQ